MSTSYSSWRHRRRPTSPLTPPRTLSPTLSEVSSSLISATHSLDLLSPLPGPRGIRAGSVTYQDRDDDDSSIIFTTTSSLRSASSFQTRPLRAVPRHTSRVGQTPPTGPRSLYIPPHFRSTASISTHPSRHHPPCPIPFVYTSNLSRQIDVLPLTSLDPLQPARITNVQVAGGYKWVDNPVGSGPAIVVPGIPDIWVGRGKKKEVLRRDEELEGIVEFPDYNAANVPEGYDPLEPVFNSLLSPMTLRDVRVLTSRNNLRKLFTFCYSPSSPRLNSSKSPRYQSLQSRYPPSPATSAFRIDARVIPNTSLVILSRWDPPNQRRGRTPANWHLSYHEANTLCVHPGSDRTPGCHRVVKYMFGGMGMMVKSDVGAALPWEELFSGDSSGDSSIGIQDDLSGYGDPGGNVDDDDELMSLDTDVNTVNTLNHSAFSDSRRGSDFSSVPPPRTLSSGITVISSSIPHPPQGHLISLKTRERPPGRTLDLQSISHVPEVFAGLFFGQIHILRLGRHHRGEFEQEDQRYTMGKGVLAVMEGEYQQTIRRVRKVLGWMVSMTTKYLRLGFVGWNGEIVAFERDKVDQRGERGEMFSEETWQILRRSGIVYRP